MKGGTFTTKRALKETLSVSDKVKHSIQCEFPRQAFTEVYTAGSSII